MAPSDRARTRKTSVGKPGRMSLGSHRLRGFDRRAGRKGICESTRHAWRTAPQEPPDRLHVGAILHEWNAQRTLGSTLTGVREVPSRLYCGHAKGKVTIFL